MSPPAYKAALSESPLPEVLSRIAHYGVPGSISCISDAGRVTILTDEGSIIFAAPSEDTTSFLTNVLASKGISVRELEKARRELEMSGRSIGATLVARGLTTTIELLPFVRNAVDHVLAKAFEWTEGSVEFTPGKIRPPIRLAIPIRRQVLDSVRHVRNLKPLLARIGPRTTVIERADPEAGVELQEDEKGLYVAADGRRTLEDLVALPPLSPGENGRIVYGLYAIGLVRPKESQVKVKLRVNQ
ncbi:MAG: DUF4388 domain-containing protein [Thermoanaerobaculia bacterium]|nr:DUF4388 domain-containing protein [Thermoanaerobaculia bacterium]